MLLIYLEDFLRYSVCIIKSKMSINPLNSEYNWTVWILFAFFFSWSFTPLIEGKGSWFVTRLHFIDENRIDPKKRKKNRFDQSKDHFHSSIRTSIILGIFSLLFDKNQPTFQKIMFLKTTTTEYIYIYIHLSTFHSKPSFIHLSTRLIFLNQLSLL